MYIKLSFVISLIIALIILYTIGRFKKCPQDAVIVVFNLVKAAKLKFIQDGYAFVMPVIEEYAILSLKAMTAELDSELIMKDDKEITLSMLINFGISTENDLLQNAAENLLSIEEEEIIDRASDAIIKQSKLIAKDITSEELNKSYNEAIRKIKNSIESELNKLGLSIFNLSIKNIK